MAGQGWAREAKTLRCLSHSLSNPAPGSHAGRAWLRGAMDAALLHSLLETNCSLELAEELVLDGWGLPLHPEGRREPSRPGRRRLLAWRVGCARVPALERLAPCGAPRAPAAPLIPAPLSPITRSLLLLQHDLGPDRDVLASELGRSPGGEAVPRVLQRCQV